MFDSHCHLDFEELSPQLDEHLGRARATGVSGWFIPGVEPAQWERARKLSGGDVWWGAGLHPWEGAKVDDVDALCEQIRVAVVRQGAIAVGECGLDKNRGGDVSQQIRLFEAQLSLAGQLEVPVVIHQVGMQEELLASLERVGLPDAGGVVHGFGGDVSWGRALLQRGLHLGIGVGITYESRKKLIRAVTELPLDRLLIETDAPDQKPGGSEGLGTPTDLAAVCSRLAQLQGITPEEVGEATERAARTLYGLAEG